VDRRPEHYFEALRRRRRRRHNQDVTEVGSPEKEFSEFSEKEGEEGEEGDHSSERWLMQGWSGRDGKRAGCQVLSLLALLVQKYKY
jgi:hypothetical protein